MSSIGQSRTATMRAATRSLGLVAVVGLLVTGCTVTVSTTVAAADIAAVAATALSEQWSTEAEVDCGDGSVESAEGTVLDCTAHNPNSGLDYPAEVTITKIEGTQYTVSVEVGSAIVDKGMEAPDEEEPAAAPTVSPDALATLAANALEKEFGYIPMIDCGTERISAVLGETTSCVATLDDGVDYPADIVFTAVSTTDYSINVQVGAAPLQ